MNAPERPLPRLTELTHGGGCGCKVAPAVLKRILGDTVAATLPEALLVGIETSDDAAVYQLNERQAIVATTDFFTPIVDDPFDFGAISAANAISDVYAMGATPLFALAIVGMPVNTLPLDVIRRILAGGASVCGRAGIPIAGGHTIDSAEPIYGLVAIGIVDPRDVKRNAGARPGDVIILGKPLGIGIYGAALRKGKLSVEQYRTLVGAATQLNTPGIDFARIGGVHAMTDVTGFGLLGHLLEICRATNVGARIRAGQLPMHAGVATLAAQGFVSGASRRNLDGCGADVRFPPEMPDAEAVVLADPQTSGGLLVAVAPDSVDRVLSIFRDQGFGAAAPIGEIVEGPARVIVL